MTEFETTLWASITGAAVGSIFSIVGTLVGAWLTQRRERRQQVWQREIDRVIELEERAGQLVELVCSYHAPETIAEKARSELPKLANDAGRFRRHKRLMQAIRELQHHLSLLIADKLEHEDYRDLADKVHGLYDDLLKECDRVTGKRKV